MVKSHRKRRQRGVIGSMRRKNAGGRRFLKIRIKLAALSQALGLILLCSSVIFFASWVGLLDLLRIDSWVERKFIAYAKSFTSGEIDQNVVLITASEDPQRNGGLGKPDEKWRGYHARLLDALTKAGAKVVAFDLLFEGQSDSKTDQNFGEVIKNAGENGTTVVIGVNQFMLETGVPVPFVTVGLRSYLGERNWGLVRVGGVDKDSTVVRKLRMAEEVEAKLPSWATALEPMTVPSFALQVVRAGLVSGTGTLTYQKRDGQITLRDNGHTLLSIPVDEALDFIVDEKETAALDRINHPYHEVYDNLTNSEYLRNLFGGKIVIIGFLERDDLRAISSGENRYGVQIQANAISDLLDGVYISKLSQIKGFLATVVMSAIGFVMGSRYRHLMRYKVPIELSVVRVQIDLPILLFVVSAAYLVTAILLYKHSRVLLAIPYHLAVLFLTFWLTDQIGNMKRSSSG